MIAVTGASGTIGRALVGCLAERGEPVRALSRHSIEHEGESTVEWVNADLADARAFAGALDGCDRMFLLTGNSDDMVRLQKNAIRAAERAGIDRVVKLSALGASDHSRSVIGLWHYNVERELRESALGWTILRPHHFMQNVLDPLVFDRTSGQVRSSSGDGAIPFVDTRDIAEVAAFLLVEDTHQGEICVLTGPEALSYRDATAILSRSLARSLVYVAESPDEAWQRRRAAGQPVWLAAAQLAIAEYQRAGGPTARTTDTIQRITGRPARTFHRFVRDHIDALRTGA